VCPAEDLRATQAAAASHLRSGDHVCPGHDLCAGDDVCPAHHVRSGTDTRPADHLRAGDDLRTRDDLRADDLGSGDHDRATQSPSLRFVPSACHDVCAADDLRPADHVCAGHDLFTVTCRADHPPTSSAGDS
jgi:hypothetical protein